jgi:hypothetical protein
MPRCRLPARRAVSRPVCADEKNPALSVDRKLFGTSTIGPHSARPTPAVLLMIPTRPTLGDVLLANPSLLRYCARPPFALERLSVIRGPDGRITRIRYVLPRHKAANWVGPGRGRKSTRPGATGVVELTPFEFFDRLADLVPPPRKHRHRYHGVFAPNHPLRQAVTALAVGNVGKQRPAVNNAHAGRRTARTAADLARPRAAHKLGRTRPGP